MSVSSYERLCHAGREHDMPDADTMTLSECVAETGWKPELCLSIPDPDEQLRVQLEQARAAVRNARTREAARA